MAYSKKPTYSFADENSTGINKVPQGRIVTIDSYFGKPKMFLTGDLKALTDDKTVEDAITEGLLTNVGTGGSGGSSGGGDPDNPTPGGPESADSPGFGCGVASKELVTSLGFTGMPGYNDPISDYYGNYEDSFGNIFVFIPKFYFKWDRNTVYVSSTPKSDYVIHRAFINAGKEIEGFFIGKYQFDLNGDKATSVPGPVKTDQQGYLFLDQANALGDRYTLINSFMFNALAILTKAQSQSGKNAAWLDVKPYYPKGNTNNGKDANDTSITFTGSTPAHTGSGVPFAKTTHNGQNCGVADLNGNVWEFGLGLTSDGTKLFIPKESTDMAKFISDVGSDASETRQCAFGELAYLTKSNGFFEELITTGSACELVGSDHAILGNGAQKVFPFIANRNNYQYKQCCVGIPLSTGCSSNGTEEFGNDCIYYVTSKTKYLMPLFGGYWDDGVTAGSFAQLLYYHRTSSYTHCGSRLAVIP